MTNLLRRLVGLLCIFLVSGCASNHQGISNKLASCGMGTAPYAEFQKCCQKSLAVSSKDPNDYYAKSRKAVMSEVDFYGDQVKRKKTSKDKAYTNLREILNQKIVEEQQQAQTAGAVVAVALLGVAAASCANNGGCGGGNSYSNYTSNYSGNCPCPGDRDAAGNRCGARSAYSRTGGASPYCPTNRL